MLISVVSLWLLSVSVSSSGVFEKFSYVHQFAKPVFSTKEKEKIEELENFLSDLWKLDENRMNVGENIEVKVPKSVNLLSYFKPAKDELFQAVSKDMLKYPTYEAFIHLLDNYNPDTEHTEYTTYDRMQEIWTFLHAISETEVIKHTHKFLVKMNLAPKSMEDFLGFLYEMWFTFKRPGSLKVSMKGGEQFAPFEHIFVGELHGDTFHGYHNWIQLYRQEESHKIRVTKFTRKACSDKPHFLSVYFESTITKAKMNGAYVLLGTSPEFELAAYTTVFLMGLPGKLTVNGCSIYLVCTRQLFDKWRPGTCYPKDTFL
ncbi:Poly(U)-specific endoribonuclease-B [Clonorchis sinensis]|uniref:Uridylate-specific endoribonuclease n=1 Tax=Clonorchis sinensis TaxID=79923 RepID=A0A419Q3X9_CLOSI|nr:Poly(U)-specific endoribonuclease-B [Clonorchis sinensis]